MNDALGRDCQTPLLGSPPSANSLTPWSGPPNERAWNSTECTSTAAVPSRSNAGSARTTESTCGRSRRPLRP